jgi:hypothetical protein
MTGKLKGVMPCDHPERLTHRVDVHPGGDLLGVAALEEGRHAGGELDVLEAPGHLAGRVGQDLAVLGGHDRGEIVRAVVEQLAHREEHRRPARQRRLAPLDGGLTGARHGGVDVRGRGQQHLAGDLAGGRVVDAGGSRRGQFGAAATDPVWNSSCHGPNATWDGLVVHRIRSAKRD